MTTIFLVSSSAFLAQAPVPGHEINWGTVEGVVLTQDGERLGNATVTAYMQEQMLDQSGRKSIRDTTQYETNAAGEFTLHLPEGKVRLLAEKRAEGYPYSFFAFYIMPGQFFPTVVVKPNTTTQVVIRVGAKAAHLVYEAVDEDGKLVPGGFVFMRLDQSAPYSTSAPASDDLLVPTSPFRATFEAKGYKAWHYGGDEWQSKEGILSLKSGEVLTLTIHLHSNHGGP